MHTLKHIHACRPQEAKPYKQDPEIVSMTNLVAAFQRNDINDFEKILRTNK